MHDLHSLARHLDDAARQARAIERLSAASPLSLADAYEIQSLLTGLRLERRESLCGVKMGFTSRAKMRQMGVSEVIWGRLTDGMRLEDGGTAPHHTYIHPRVEPEVAFVLANRISGPVSPAEALRAVDAVAPAIELIDSRYEGFRFSHEDVVADNCSAAGFVLGSWNLPRAVDNLGVVLEVNGQVSSVGSTAAVLGDPARALAAAIRLASAAGVDLAPGTIILAGAATEAVALPAGAHVRVRVESLGSAGFTTSKRSSN